jgi:hypothetical protein
MFFLGKHLQIVDFLHPFVHVLVTLQSGARYKWFNTHLTNSN